MYLYMQTEPVGQELYLEDTNAYKYFMALRNFGH